MEADIEFDRLDTNHDGVIDREEWACANQEAQTETATGQCNRVTKVTFEGDQESDCEDYQSPQCDGVQDDVYSAQDQDETCDSEAGGETVEEEDAEVFTRTSETHLTSQAQVSADTVSGADEPTCVKSLPEVPELLTTALDMSSEADEAMRAAVHTNDIMKLWRCHL